MRRDRDRFGAGMHTAFAADYARARSAGRLAALRFLAVTLAHSPWFAIAGWLPRPQVEPLRTARVNRPDSVAY